MAPPSSRRAHPGRPLPGRPAAAPIPSRPRTAHRLVALAGVLALLLTGCTIRTAESGTDAQGVTTLRFWHYYTGTQLAWLEQETARFEAENPDVRVALVDVVGEQQGQKLLASVSIGNGPDLLINNIVVDFQILSGAGVMHDVTEEWESFADREQFPESTAWREDGRVYNLLPYTNLLGMYYNADVLAEAGVEEVPDDLEELEQAMAQVAENTDAAPMAMSGSPDVQGAWLFAPQLLGLGVDYCSLDSTEVDTAFERMDRWAERGYLPQATATWGQSEAWQQFMTGRYAFGLNGNWNLGNAGSAGFEWGTARYPAPVGGESVVFPGGEGVAIGADTRYPDLAWRYLEDVFLSAEGARSINATAGSIPVRADVAESEELSGDDTVRPFVEAAQEPGTWPDNVNTAQMQEALGQAVSGVTSGQLSGEQGAAQARAAIAEARADGGGGC